MMVSLMHFFYVLEKYYTKMFTTGVLCTVYGAQVYFMLGQRARTTMGKCWPNIGPTRWPIVGPT